MNDTIRKQVIVALVRQAHSRVEQLGKTQFQKLIYFLQEQGVPLEYKYEIYHYGPYSFELANDLGSLDTLELLDVSTDVSGFGFNIQLGGHAESVQWPEQYESQLQFVLDTVGSDTPSQLEVKATTHFVKKVLEKRGQDSRKEIVVEKVRQLKPHFSDGFVSKCYDELRATHII